MKPQFSLGAFAIITDEQDRVLLGLRTDRDMWNLPGGVIEHGESPWEAVVREVKEETGLEVKVDKMLGVYSKDYENDMVFMFKCSVTGGDLTLSDEAKELQYYTKEGVPENTNERQKLRIIDYYERPEEFVMAVHSKS